MPSWLCHLTRSFKEQEDDSIHTINFDLWSHSKQPEVLPRGLRGGTFVGLLSAAVLTVHCGSSSPLSAFAWATCEEVFLLQFCPQGCQPDWNVPFLQYAVLELLVLCWSLVSSTSRPAGISLPTWSEESVSSPAVLPLWGARLPSRWGALPPLWVASGSFASALAQAREIGYGGFRVPASSSSQAAEGWFGVNALVGRHGSLLAGEPPLCPVTVGGLLAPLLLEPEAWVLPCMQVCEHTSLLGVWYVPVNPEGKITREEGVPLPPWV